MDTDCTPTSSRPSLVRQATAARRMDALFKAMSGDFLLREQFVTEPSQIVAEYLQGRKLSPDEAEVSDQLIYSVMANERLLARLAQLGRAPGAATPGGNEFAREFSKAVVETGASHVVTALLRASAERQDVFAASAALAVILGGAFGGGIGVAHTEMSTGHSTATEMSTGHFAAHTEMSTGHSTGTEMSTGHFAAHTEMSTGHSTGTEMSTGHFAAHTEMSTGHSTGTEMSTGHFAAHTEMSTGHSTGTEMSTGHGLAKIGKAAARLIQKELGSGRLVAQTDQSTGHSTGTDMSTGHSAAHAEMGRGHFAAQTDQSTGHQTGTDKSTGHSSGSELFAEGFRRVTFSALIEHAVRLRSLGALDFVR